MLESLEIEEFRGFKKIEVKIGKRLTLIAGKNGTSKSTLLGMVAQPFGLRGEGRKKSKYETILNEQFKTNFSEIFKLSEKFDIPEKHIYYINYTENGEKKKEIVKSRVAKDRKPPIRIVVGGTRRKGDGNIDIPVIYLGLSRLYPLGELPSLAKLKIGNLSLTEIEIKELIETYKKIMNSIEKNINLNTLTSGNKYKNTIVMSTDSHDYLSNSLGQDNLYKILGAVFSFKKLKQELNNDYNGGFLLIDELEASMHPSALIKLFKYLYKVSEELDIQIVASTHSITLLKEFYRYKKGKPEQDTSLIYLTKSNGKLKVFSDINLADIYKDLYIMTDIETKVNIYTEDEEARLFLERILNRNPLKKKINIMNIKLSCNNYFDLVKGGIPEFNENLIMLDGDEKSKSKYKNYTNIQFLPGGKSIENLMLDFIDNNLEDDYWEDFGYTKEWHENLKNQYKLYSERNRINLKRWFNDKEILAFFGKNLIDSWLLNNNKEKQEFLMELEKIINELYKNKIEKEFYKL